MAASLVQPNCICTCHSSGHVHHYDRDNRHSQVYGGMPFVGVPAPSFQHGQGQGHGATEHTFSTAPSIASVVSHGNGNGLGGEIVEPRIYPFKGNHIKHTHASFRRDTLPELGHHTYNAQTQTNGAAHHMKIPGIPSPPGITPSPSLTTLVGGKGINSWALCLPIPIPLGLPNTTLESLTYTIRYGSYDTGSASVQADLVLGRGAKVNEGIVTDCSKVPIYHHDGHGGGYGAPMVNEAMGMGLVSVPAFKSSGGTGWSHYLDHQKVFPNVRIGEDTSYAAHATSHGHSGYHDGCHLYLFFHVYEYPGADAQRSLSVDVSARWNDGEELKKAKEAREREVKEMRMERERLVLMKREVEVAIGQLEESMRKAGEESKRRMKEEREMEKELKEQEEEFLEAERKAREEHSARVGEERERLRELEEKERKAEEEHVQRMKEEEDRRRLFEETERKAKEEHVHRMKDEDARLREIELAEQRATAEHHKHAEEEAARMKEIEEAQRKFKEETERHAKDDAERRARDEAGWKAHEEAERKAREDAERWAKDQAAVRAKEEEALKEEARKAKEAAAAATAAKVAIPSVAEAPHVADDRMQVHIEKIAAKLGQKCKNGYAWEKKPHGYKCSGGGHFISFKDLGMA